MPTTFQPQVRAARKALTDEGSFATTLLLATVDVYGTEMCSWTPETILMHLNEDFNIRMPAVTFDRLMAAIGLLTTDDFYKSLPDFIWYCNILSGDSFEPNLWDPAEADEIAWAITEAMLIAPPDDNDDAPFIPEITGYIGTVLDNEGIVNAPDVLNIATRQSSLGSLSHYSDDPEMFQTLYDFQSDRSAAIVRMLRANLQELAAQMQALTLYNGDALDAIVKTLKTLR